MELHKSKGDNSGPPKMQNESNVPSVERDELTEKGLNTTQSGKTHLNSLAKNFQNMRNQEGNKQLAPKSSNENCANCLIQENQAKTLQSTVLSCNVTPVLATSKHSFAFHTSLIAFPNSDFTPLHSVQVQTPPCPSENVTNPSPKFPAHNTITTTEGTDCHKSLHRQMLPHSDKPKDGIKELVTSCKSPMLDPQCKTPNLDTTGLIFCKQLYPTQTVKWSKPDAHKYRHLCKTPPTVSYPCAIPKTRSLRKRENKTCEMEFSYTSEMTDQAHELNTENGKVKYSKTAVENAGKNKKTQLLSASVLRDKRLENELQQGACNKHDSDVQGSVSQNELSSENMCKKLTSLYLCDNRMLHPSKDGRDTGALLQLKHQHGIKIPIKTALTARKNPFYDDECIKNKTFQIEKDKRHLLSAMLKQCMVLLNETNSSCNSGSPKNELNTIRIQENNNGNMTSRNSNSVYRPSNSLTKLNAKKTFTSEEKTEAAVFTSKYCSESNDDSQSCSSIVVLSERITLNQNCKTTHSATNTISAIKSHHGYGNNRETKGKTSIARLMQPKVNGIIYNPVCKEVLSAVEESVAHSKLNNVCPRKVVHPLGTGAFGAELGNLHPTKYSVKSKTDKSNYRVVNSSSSPKEDKGKTVENSYKMKPTVDPVAETSRKYKKYKVYFGLDSDSNDKRRGAEILSGIGGQNESNSVCNKVQTSQYGSSSFIRIRCNTAAISSDRGKEGSNGQNEAVSLEDLEERIGEKLQSVIEGTKSLKEDIAALHKCKEKENKKVKI